MSASPADKGATDSPIEYGDTRCAIVDAFNSLIMNRDYDAVTTGELIERSGIARSTFYAHFANKEAVLFAAIEPLLAVLADTRDDTVTRALLMRILGHFWENRRRARALLTDRTFFRLCAKLASMIAQGRPGADAADGRYDAASYSCAVARLGLLRAWLAGGLPSNVEPIADQLLALRLPSNFMSSAGPSGVSIVSQSRNPAAR